MRLHANGILIHPAVWPKWILAENWGGAPPPLWEGAGSPSNTMWPGPRPTCTPSFILIHPFGHNTPTSQTGQTRRTGQTDRQTVVQKLPCVLKPAVKRYSFTADCLPVQAVLSISLPVKSIAKAEGERRLPLTTISRAGLITDERHIAPPASSTIVCPSAQYKILHSAPYDFCLMSDVYVSVNKNTVQ